MVAAKLRQVLDIGNAALDQAGGVAEPTVFQVIAEISHDQLFKGGGEIFRLIAEMGAD